MPRAHRPLAALLAVVSLLLAASSGAAAQEPRRDPPAPPAAPTPPAPTNPPASSPVPATGPVTVVTQLSAIPEGSGLVTLVYQPRCARVNDLATLCQMRLRDSRAIQVVSSTNSLVLTDTGDNLRTLARVLDAADRFTGDRGSAPSRRFLEVTVLEVTPGEERALPMAGGRRDTAQLVGEAATALVDRLLLATRKGADGITVLVDGAFQLEEGREVTFSSGDRVPYQGVASAPGGGTVTSLSGSVEAGIELRMKWYVSERGGMLDYNFESSRWGEAPKAGILPPARFRESVSGTQTLEEGKGVLVGALAASSTKGAYLIIYLRLKAA